MRKFLLTIFAVTLAISAFAQAGGMKGVVVSRDDREPITGVAILMRMRMKEAAVSGMVLTVFFTIVSIFLLVFDPIKDCGCFGQAVTLTHWETFFKNLIMLPMVAIVWYRYRRHRILEFKKIEVVLAVAFINPTFIENMNVESAPATTLFPICVPPRLATSTKPMWKSWAIPFPMS